MHDMSDVVAGVLRRLNPAARAFVTGRDLATARDPSSVVITRCSEVMRDPPPQVRRNYWHQLQIRNGHVPILRERGASRSPSPWREAEVNPALPGIKDFVRQWTLGGGVALMLRQLDPAGAEEVIEHTPLSGSTRSATAVVACAARELLERRKTVLISRDHPNSPIGIDFDTRGTPKVCAVRPGSPAAKVDVVPGSVVVAVDGAPVTTTDAAKRASSGLTQFLVTLQEPHRPNLRAHRDPRE